MWLSGVKSVAILSIIFTFFLLMGCQGSQSILEPASFAANMAAKLWWGIFIFFALVFLIVSGLWLYAMKPKKTVATHTQSKQLIRYLIVWGGIGLPTISIVFLLVFGIPIGQIMQPALDGKVMEIQVIGHQWYWEVYYPEGNFKLINEMHLPVKERVDVSITSQDVIHSFWVPSLNGKMDAIPGHTNVLRLEASREGHYRGQCAEFCGLWHAQMILDVEVHNKKTFTAWFQRLAKTNNKEPRDNNNG